MWLELHHIRWYSHGGETLPLNLITLCSGCHASVHEGRLKICGNLKDGLIFTGAREKSSLESVESLKFLLA